MEGRYGRRINHRMEERLFGVDKKRGRAWPEIDPVSAGEIIVVDYTTQLICYRRCSVCRFFSLLFVVDLMKQLFLGDGSGSDLPTPRAFCCTRETHSPNMPRLHTDIHTNYLRSFPFSSCNYRFIFYRVFIADETHNRNHFLWEKRRRAARLARVACERSFACKTKTNRTI